MTGIILIISRYIVLDFQTIRNNVGAVELTIPHKHRIALILSRSFVQHKIHKWISCAFGRMRKYVNLFLRQYRIVAHKTTLSRAMNNSNLTSIAYNMHKRIQMSNHPFGPLKHQLEMARNTNCIKSIRPSYTPMLLSLIAT